MSALTSALVFTQVFINFVVLYRLRKLERRKAFEHDSVQLAADQPPIPPIGFFPGEPGYEEPS